MINAASGFLETAALATPVRPPWPRPSDAADRRGPVAAGAGRSQTDPGASPTSSLSPISPTSAPSTPLSGAAWPDLAPAFPVHPPSKDWNLSTDQFQPWLLDVFKYLVPSVLSPDRSEVRVLSHAMPSPLSSAHIFPSTISALLHYPAQSNPWLQVSHAVQTASYLSDLTTATTPALGPSDESLQQAYRVFNVLVPLSSSSTTPNENSWARPNKETKVPQTKPTPAVPPNSIHLTIMERYIPPSNLNEITSLFSATGPSALRDRLNELSTDNGHALFVYPTRKGGNAFMRSHLGPALDPLLRSLSVVHTLPSELITLLGTMPAVDEMLEFADMYKRLSTMCSQMSASHVGSARTNKEQESRIDCDYEVVFARKTVVLLDGHTWPEKWWAAQEQERIKSLFRTFISNSAPRQLRSNYSTEAMPGYSKGYSQAPPLPSRSISSSTIPPSSHRSLQSHRTSIMESNTTPTILTHEIINGLASRVKARCQSIQNTAGGRAGGASGMMSPPPVSPAAAHPSSSRRLTAILDEAIEVGVFIIRKTATAACKADRRAG